MLCTYVERNIYILGTHQKNKVVRSNQVIVKEFLNSIVKIVSEGSSDKYVMMVLSRFINGHSEVFPLSKYIHIDLQTIVVDKKINYVNPKDVGKFLRVLVKSLFSDLFMLLVKKKIPKRLAEDLEYLGIKMNGDL